jgi:hypothetical protein
MSVTGPSVLMGYRSGIDSVGTFYCLPYQSLRKHINLFIEKKLTGDEFARNLLSWKHSGFLINNSVTLLFLDTYMWLQEQIDTNPDLRC